MLKPDAASEQLASWRLDEGRQGERLLGAMKPLPKGLRVIGYRLFGLDAQGKSVRPQEWQAAEAERRRVAIDFEALSDKDRVRLFRALMPGIADWVDAGWQLLKSSPYQVGYERKAFRAPKDPSLTLGNRVEWLTRLVRHFQAFDADAISLKWLAQWTPHAIAYGGGCVGPVLAAAINADGPDGREVFEILRQSLNNDHEVGRMGQHVIRSLLMADREEGWELLEKALLAAQRQEGLRQAILELVDESHPRAFRRMLTVVEEHDLVRFSAVARSVNVWLGLLWDSSAVKAINDSIVGVRRLLDDPPGQRKALAGSDPQAIHRALWCIGFEDAHAAVKAAEPLLRHRSDGVRFVAVTLLGQLGMSVAAVAQAPAIDDDNIQIALTAVRDVSRVMMHNDQEGDATRRGQKERRWAANGCFEMAERLYRRLPGKPFALPALVWPWTARQADRAEVCAASLWLLGDRPVTRLIQYLQDLDTFTQARVVGLLAGQKKWDALTRETLFGLTGNASPMVRQAAFAAIGDQELRKGEPEILEALTSRKAADVRRSVLAALIKQPNEAALASADRLTLSKDPLQRVAGLDLLRQLADSNRDRAACQQRAAAYAKRAKKIGKEEQIQLAATADSGRALVTLGDALGLMDPARRSPVMPPRRRAGRSLTSATACCLRALDELIHEHREAPVKIQTPSGLQDRLLGTLSGWDFPDVEWRMPAREVVVEKLPLRSMWLDWCDSRPKACRDSDGFELVRGRTVMTALTGWKAEKVREWLGTDATRARIVREIIGECSEIKLRYPPIVEHVLDWLNALRPVAGAAGFILDRRETAYAMVTDEMLRTMPRATDVSTQAADSRGGIRIIGETCFTRDPEHEDWRDATVFRHWEGPLIDRELRADVEHIRRQWELARWRDEPTPGAVRRRPDIAVTIAARKAGFATIDDVIDQLLGPRERQSYGTAFVELEALTARQPDDSLGAELRDFPELAATLDRIRARVLDVELTRGEPPTPATQPALAIRSYFGTTTLFRVMAAINRATFKRDSSWFSDGTSRGATLTHLLRTTYPSPGDTQVDFNRLAEQATGDGYCDDQRLLELAFLAPQWAKHVESFLQWQGFAEGLYWFVAHMDTGWNSSVEQAAAEAEGIEKPAEHGANDEDSAEEVEPVSDGLRPARRKLSSWQRLVLERTALTTEERKAGAVDVEWFHRAWEMLGGHRWGRMAAAARYASNPAQAKKARFLADVLLGTTPRKELIDGIRVKQRKDDVRLLGLLPLAAGSARDRDILERYEVLQGYRRYARTLSGLTKPEAMRACDIGFENLARLAGFRDPLRLEWAMEAQSVCDLAEGPISETGDGVTVTLALDGDAQPEVTIRRGDKALKTVPPAIRKQHAAVAELIERGTDLRRKAGRMKRSLESAMCRGDVFTGAEVEALCGHAILSPLLTRLALVGETDEKVMGYPENKGESLRDHAGKLTAIKSTDLLRIAHPADFLRRKDWERWQHECFSAERVQPFKQVFRELYPVTKQERSDGALSHRYAGQQINPSQAFALWSARGWSTQDDVFKTFHEVGITACVVFQYNAGTAADVEGLTLSSIGFRLRDQPEPMALKDVPPRIFSEVMRDVDLVVSVAHRGGVDPEASASTIDMRAALLREACGVLSLENVRIKAPHVLISGTLADYSVHLGSATVHRMPGGAIFLIPVHAQHRGRLFLPFADDDPRTAELVSKVVLLARDREIQDPSILDQLR